MRYPKAFRKKIIKARKEGLSLKEISVKFSISKSTASLWLRDIKLDKKAQKRLKKRKLLGYYKTQLTRQRKRKKLFNKLNREAFIQTNKIKFDKNYYLLLCAVFYWAEGTHSCDTVLKFINSEPLLIKTFLKLLRNSFTIDNKKFRALLHLHEYHNEQKQKEYWSKITGIPLSQFYRSYLKPHTKKRIRDNYPGCIAINYMDHLIAKKLIVTYNVFAKTLGV